VRGKAARRHWWLRAKPQLALSAPVSTTRKASKKKEEATFKKDNLSVSEWRLLSWRLHTSPLLLEAASLRPMLMLAGCCRRGPCFQRACVLCRGHDHMLTVLCLGTAILKWPCFLARPASKRASEQACSLGWLLAGWLSHDGGA